MMPGLRQGNEYVFSVYRRSIVMTIDLGLPRRTTPVGFMIATRAAKWIVKQMGAGRTIKTLGT
jgi:hypothetical protein